MDDQFRPDPEIIGREYDLFISYDHENEQDSQAAVRLYEALSAAGYLVWWDQQMRAGRWTRQIGEKASRAKRVLTLETVRYATRHWCVFEMNIGLSITGLVRVKLEECEPPEAIRAHLAGDHYLRVDADDAAFTDKVIAHLDVSPSRRAPAELAKGPGVELGDLPPAPEALIGREDETAILDQAWAKGDKTVVVLHAVGGAGKSAILSTFVDAAIEARSRGEAGAASRIFAWSAYSQGSGNSSRADADGFIAEALTFFGGDPAAHRTTVDQAKELARRVSQERALLVMDGVEPLQSPPKVDGGRLTNKALATLIRKLAVENRGLCVITSRQELPELPRLAQVVNHPLDRLETEGGVALLTHLGVTGRPRDLKDAVEDVRGHALSLTLLGTFLDNVEAGDVARRDQFRFEDLPTAPLDEDEDPTEGAARRAERVMDGYLEQLDKAPGGGAVERTLLSILGLFDRPADGPAVRALLAGPPIPGLTDALFQLFEWGEEGLTETFLDNYQKAQRWRRAKERLRALGLLAAEDAADRDALDAHPIVRSYFRRRVRETEPEAWIAANDRLYGHYAAAAPELPDTVAEMHPLFHAIAHGVAAGKAQEAWSDVYQARIERREAHFITHQLGAFGAALTALAPFFDPPWRASLPALTAPDRAAALNYAAFALRGLGRLADAAEPMRAGLALRVEQENWKQAALDAGNLSELLLTIGDIAGAAAAAEEARRHAEAAADLEERMNAESQAGDAAHQAGRLDAAAERFRAAEKLQAEFQPSYPRLVTLSGYAYGDLLLSRGAAAEALERAEWLTSAVSPNQPDRLSRALYTLFLGRAQAARAGAGAAPRSGLFLRVFRPDPAPAERAERLAAARAHLDDAVAGLRAAGREDHTPHGLLARAAFLRERAAEGDAAARALALEDLEEAFEIATYGGMRLFLADIALERTRWALTDGDKSEARKQFDIAKALIEECGYGRRTPELEELAKRL